MLSLNKMDFNLLLHVQISNLKIEFMVNKILMLLIIKIYIKILIIFITHTYYYKL